MRIAFVTETYPPEINGVALTVQSLVHGCRKLGHFVELIRPRQPGAEVASPQRLVLEHPWRGAALPFYPGLQFGFPGKAKLMRLWRHARPDGIYVATEGPLGFSAVSAARALGIPVLTGLHTRFDDFMNHYGLPWLSRPAFAFMRAFHARADATLVPTQALQQSLTAAGFSRVKVLSRAVDTGLFNPLKRNAALRAKWGLAPDQLAVLFVGRIAPEKNLDLAVQSFQAIRARFPGARQIWVGDGPALKALKARHSHDQGMVFCGMLRDEQLAMAYASADMFVFPSLSETFGNVTLEALASGLPVCAFDYGAAAEAIRPACNGYATCFGDAKAFVQASINLAEQMQADREILRASARASVERLDPNAVAAQLVALFAAQISLRQSPLRQPAAQVSEINHA